MGKSERQKVLLGPKIASMVNGAIWRMVDAAKKYYSLDRHLDVAIDITYIAYYGDLPEVVITDGARGYGAAFGRLRIRHRVLVHGSRNRIERWMQELKRRIDTFYASFTGDTVEPTHNWLRQFAWFWNHCLS